METSVWLSDRLLDAPIRHTVPAPPFARPAQKPVHKRVQELSPRSATTTDIQPEHTELQASPARDSFSTKAGIVAEASRILTRNLAELNRISPVAKQLPDSYADNALDIVASIRDAAEIYARILVGRIGAEIAAAGGTVSDRKLAGLAHVSNKTIAHWRERPVALWQVEAMRKASTPPHT